MQRRIFNFRGLGSAGDTGGFGATFDDILAVRPIVGQFRDTRVPGVSVAPPPISLSTADLALDMSPVAAQADAADLQAASDALAAEAAAREAAETAKKAAEAKAEFERLTRERAMGSHGEYITPQSLLNAKAEADEAQRRADMAQAQHEAVSTGARLMSALKWAFVPLGAGAILLGFGYKKLGAGALLLGTGAGAFRFFKPPAEES